MENESKMKKQPKILIVDDVSINVEILENIIQAEGYIALCALSVQEALDIMDETMPDLILSDYTMPGMNGMEFCRLLKSNPRTRNIPFIFITVADTREDKREAFLAGAVDFIPKPFEPVEVIMRVNNHLNSFHARREMEEYNRMMHKTVFEQKKQMDMERQGILLAIAKAVEKRCDNEGRNLERVGCNCHILAQSLQLVPKFEKEINDEFVETIETASKLHDIGRMVRPADESAQGSDPEQLKKESIKIHTEEGAQILKEISEGGNTSNFLEMAIEIAGYHHARWNGKGYPEGVGGKDIPLAARITAIVNDFDILLGKYHDSEDGAVIPSMKVISEGSGTLYDPDIVEVFNKVQKQLRTS